jgi:ribosomal-protein-alanine N-acetyltransferase
MIEIRVMSYPDVPRVLAVERRAFPTPWSLSMFVLEISKPGGVCLIAVEDDETVGYLICASYPDAYHLMNVAVDPDHRRRGVGRLLLQEMLEKTGADANITLEVRASNAPAITLYESFGFRAVGDRKRYYTDTGEDAIIMWRATGSPWEV